MSRSRAPAPARTSAARPPSKPAAARVIKKYPNRRLYDTERSVYITTAEVKQLVMAQQPFVVRDAKSGEDLTRSILLQIILEEEAGGAPLFTETVLASIIRFYGHALQGFMGAYLEKSIQALTEMQARMAEHANALPPEIWAQFLGLQSPMMQGVMTAYLEQSKNLFMQLQEQLNQQSSQVWGAFGVKR